MKAQPKTVGEEHEAFQQQLDGVRLLADSIGTLAPDDVLGRTTELHQFLVRRLLPHAVAEDYVLFPALREQSRGAETIAMTECHRQLARFTDELELVRERLGEHLRRRDMGVYRGLESDLRRILYGIHALLTAHFSKADEVFAESMGSSLSPRARTALFKRLDRYAEDIGQLMHHGG